MDNALIRTFLEVAATGSFIAAADRLFVTQSAVSLRVQRLEASLGQPLFIRSRAGAELTPAGLRFETYALSLTKIWAEAQQQIGIPESFTQSVTLGAQYSLWPRLGFAWMDALRSDRSDLMIRAELGMPDRLTRFLIEGTVQAALMYTPQLRPGLSVEKVIEEDLVMVSDLPVVDMGEVTNYVLVDWGAEFVHAHALHLPRLSGSGIVLSLGALAADYILGRGLAAYLPARSVERRVAAGDLHLVPDAPVFPYPVWAVLRDDIPADLATRLRQSLARIAEGAEDIQANVRAALDEISDDDIATLGVAE
ncbi:LysR family transcriptional regulator [Pontivivens insulae]|uniref:Putative HTH-type transcriptional regulator n=1 Tax=Pontivivens insulae TaxID=1639689 RepID=A0A2R8AA33_9RHOB|nr:LysR family transcriptional regulator [Pontivivens insulae]RED12981.1 DNA-binding transcriptional LysR family regulator [Pontivivens insulae]SPF29074.1 putative HTH-type transcriptional regulator [Pontivivens insulae]